MLFYIFGIIYILSNFDRNIFCWLMENVVVKSVVMVDFVVECGV